VLAAPSAARAEDEEEDVFETAYFGAKIECWYQPKLSLNAAVVGGLQNNQFANLFLQNSTFSAQRDLGVKSNTPEPTYLDFLGGPITLGGFVDTRWLSIEGFWVTPFEYKGDTVLTRQFQFAGATFAVSERVKTRLAQSLVGLDIKVNLLNNRFVRVSPILAIRTLAIDWAVEGTLFKASTEDIDFPLTFGRFKVFPYPEAGAEVRVGYRDFIEGDLKVTGLYINYLGVRAWTALVDVGVTGYLPFFNHVGMRLGYRYYYFEARTDDQKADRQFTADLRISGFTAALIARF
jgi:hypothetical protein